MPWDSRTGGGSASRSRAALEAAILDYVDAAQSGGAYKVFESAYAGDPTGATEMGAKLCQALQDSADFGFTLLSKPGAIYKVQQEQTLPLVFGGDTGTTYSRGYCVKVPHGARWVGMGGAARPAKLQALGTLDKVILCNARPGPVATGTGTFVLNSNVITGVTGAGWAAGQYLYGLHFKPGAKIGVYNAGAGTITMVDELGMPLYANVAGANQLLSAGHRGDVIDVSGIVVDGGLHGSFGDAQVQTIPRVWLWGLGDGHRLSDVGITNMTNVAAQLGACYGGEYDNLQASFIRGQGWCIGGNYGNQCRHGHLKRTKSWNIAPYDISGVIQFSQPGNGLFAGIADFEIDWVYSRNAAGIKIGPNSDDYHIKAMVADGRPLYGEPDNGTENSGCKPGQGSTDGTPDKCGSGTIDLIVSKYAWNAGLFIRSVEKIVIGSYIGYRNGRGSGIVNPITGNTIHATDVDIDYVDDIDGIFYSKFAGGRGVVFGPNMGIGNGRVDVRSPGQVDAVNAVFFEPGASMGGQFAATLLDDWPAITGTGNTTTGSPTITSVSAAAWLPGMPVVGAGIPVNARVGLYDPAGQTITLVDGFGAAANATATAAGVTLSSSLNLKALSAVTAGPLLLKPYRTNVTSRMDVRIGASKLAIEDALLASGTGPKEGTVTLVATTTQTDIANANVITVDQTANGGGFYEPDVTITPANAAAAALAIQPRATVSSNFTLRLIHGNATGGEIFTWRIARYMWRAAKLA